MSISFSGLASGLDTSSWVESLVSLKQAKVDSLEEEKKILQQTKEVVSSIRTFFESFRSTLNKITDSNLFKGSSMDIFAQNLAISSNASIATAFATAEAKEAIYELEVDKLATNTQALSGYRSSIVETTIATENTLLKDLGVTAGKIGIRNGGTTQNITITNNDSIATFIDKLGKIGVKADFQNGIFSIELSCDAIDDDIDGDGVKNTNIVEKLGLQGVNYGYETSNSLSIETTETITVFATGTTLLKEGFGVDEGKTGAQNLVFEADKAYHTVAIDDTTTIDSLVEAINNTVAGDRTVASYDEETGIFKLLGAKIINTEFTYETTNAEGTAIEVTVDATTTDLATKLGLEESTRYNHQSSGALSFSVTATTTIGVTGSTELKELVDESFSFNVDGNDDGEDIVVKNSNGEYKTITVYETTSVASVLADLSTAGFSATLTDEGTVEIKGGEIITSESELDIISAFNLKTEAYSGIVTGSSLSAVTETDVLAGASTKLVADLQISQGYIKATDASGNESYVKVYDGQSISQLCNDLKSAGVTLTLNSTDGTLTLESGALETLTDEEVQNLVDAGTITETDPNLIKGSDLVDKIFGSESVTSADGDVNATNTKTGSLYYNVTVTSNATTTTALGTLVGDIELVTGTVEFTVGEVTKTIDVTSEMSISDLMTALAEQTITSSWDRNTSTLTIKDAVISGGTSNLGEILDLETTVEETLTSSNGLYVLNSSMVVAGTTTELEKFGVTDGEALKVYDADGDVVIDTTISSTTKIEDLLSIINTDTATHGVSAEYNTLTGIFTVANGHIENATLESAFGLTTETGVSNAIGSSVITVTTESGVSGGSKMKDIVAALGTESTVAGGYTLFFKGIEITGVDENTSVNELCQKLLDEGAKTAVLDTNTGKLVVEGGAVTGTLAEALGIRNVSSTVGFTGTGDTLFATSQSYADGSTKLSQLNIGDTSIEVKDSANNTLTTLEITTNTDLNSALLNNETLKTEYGISGTISEGRITIVSDSGNYIAGALADTLGISTNVTTVTVSTSQTSTAKITSTQTNNALDETNLADIDALKDVSDFTITIRGENGTTIATATTLNDLVNDSDPETNPTLGDLMSVLESHSINVEYENGILTLTSPQGYYATGEVMTALGIGVQEGVTTTTTTGQSVTSTVVLSSTSTVDAQNSSTIGSCIAIPANNTLVITNSDGSSIVANITVDQNMTFSALNEQTKGYGVEIGMSNGSLSITSTNGNYIKAGDMADALGIDTQVTTTTTTVGMSITSSGQINYTAGSDSTVGTTNTGSNALTYTTTIAAGMESTLGELGIGSYELKVHEYNGDVEASTTFNSSTSLQVINDWLEDYSMTLSIDNTGVVSITPKNNSTVGDEKYVSGSLMDAMGIGVQDNGTTTVTTYTSATGLTYSTTVAAELTSKFKDMGIDQEMTINICDSNGNTLAASYTVIDGNNSIENLKSILENATGYDFNVDYSGNRISITSESGYYVTGLEALGITVSQGETITTTTGLTATGSVVSYSVTTTTTSTETATLNENTELSQLGIGNSDLLVFNGTKTVTVSVTGTTKMSEFQSQLDGAGINNTLTAGKLELLTPDSGCYIAEASTNNWFKTTFGFADLNTVTTTTTYNTTTSTTGVTQTGGVVTFDKNLTLNYDTTLGDLGLSTSSLYVYNGSSTTLLIFTTGETMTSVLGRLGDEGINATITASGELELLTPDEGCYIEEGISTNDWFGETFGIGDYATTSVDTTTTTIGNTWTSNVVTYNKTVTLNSDTSSEITFGDLGVTNSFTVTLIDAATGAVEDTWTIESESQLSGLNTYYTEDFGITFGFNDNGTVSVDYASNGYYLKSDELENLFGLNLYTVTTSTTEEVTTTTVGATQSGNVISYNTTTTTTTDATFTYETRFDELNPALGDDYILVNVYGGTSGTLVDTITLDPSDTIEMLDGYISEYGMSATVTNGVTSITSDNGYWIESAPLQSMLGLTWETVTTTTTVFNTLTTNSGHGLTYTKESTTARESTTLGELGYSSGITDTATMYSSTTGAAIRTISLTGTSGTTIDSFLYQITRSYDFTYSMSGGSITLDSDTLWIESATLSNVFGIGTTSVGAINTTVGTSVTSTAQITYTKTAGISTTLTSNTDLKYYAETYQIRGETTMWNLAEGLGWDQRQTLTFFIAKQEGALLDDAGAGELANSGYAIYATDSTGGQFSTQTLNEFISTVNSYVGEGYLTFDGGHIIVDNTKNANNYVLRGTLTDYLGMDAIATTSSGTVSGGGTVSGSGTTAASGTVYLTTDSDYFYNVSTPNPTSYSITASTSTTMSSLGLSTTAYITVMSNYTLQTITVDSTMTLGSLDAALTSCGIDMTIDSSTGRVRLKNFSAMNPVTGKYGYILGMDSTLAYALNINTSSYGEGKTYNVTENAIADESTTFAEIYGDLDMTIQVKSTSGTTTTMSYTETDTIGNMITGLENCGVSASIENGYLNITGNSSAYVILMNPSQLKFNALHFGSSTNTIFYSGTTTTLKENTTNSQVTIGGNTITVNSTTTLNALGLSAGDSFVVFFGNQYGDENSLTLSSSNTVGEMVSYFNSFGVSTTIDSNGNITFANSNSGYIKAIGNVNGSVSTVNNGKLDWFQNAFKLSGNNFTVINTTTTGECEFSDDVITFRTVTTTTTSTTLNDNTKLEQIGMAAGTTQTLWVHNGTTLSTIHISSTDDMNTLKGKLGSVNIEATTDGGKLNLSPMIEGAYIQYGSSNAWFNSLFKLSGSSETIATSTTTITTTSTVAVDDTGTETLTPSLPRTLNYTTTWADLGISNKTLSVKYSNANFNIKTDSYTDMESFTSVLTEDYGITVSIDNGTFKVLSCADGSYIREGVAGNQWFYDLFGITDTETVSVSTTTTTVGVTDTNNLNITYDKPFTLKNDTTFADLGFTSGQKQYVELYNATTGNFDTVTVTDTTTLTQFHSMVSTKSSGTISSTVQANGTLKLTPSGNSYITNSTTNDWLKTTFNISGNFANETENTETITNYVTTGVTGTGSEKTYNTQIVTTTTASQTLTGATNLKDNLGINEIKYIDTSSGQITVTVGTNMTTLCEQLTNAGIKATIDGGKLVLEPQGGNYLLETSTNAWLNNVFGVGTDFYTVTEEITNGNTPSNYLSVTAPATAGVTTKLSQLGVTENFVVTVTPLETGGTPTTTTISKETSIEDFVSILTNDLDANASFDSATGKLTISDGVNKVESDAFAQLGLTQGTQTITLKTNDTSNSFNQDTIITANTQTALSTVGIGSGLVISTNNNGTPSTVTTQEGDTFETWFGRLDAAGIEAEIIDGKVTFTAKSGSYITAVDSGLESKLGISGPYSNVIVGSAETSITMSNSLADVLGDTAYAPHYSTIDYWYNGGPHTYTVEENDSFATVASELSAATDGNLTFTVVDGKVSIIGNENAYVTGVGTILQDHLKLSAGNNISYTVETDTTGSNTTDGTHFDSTTGAELGDAKVGNLNGGNGLTQNATITYVTNGVTNTTTISNATDITAIPLVISTDGGKVTFKGDANNYIVDMSDELANLLGVEVGDGKSYTTSTSTLYTNDPSNSIKVTDTGATVDFNTALSSVTGYSHGNGKIAINNNGSISYINVNKDGSVYDFAGDVLTATDGKVQIDIDEANGTVSITGDGNIKLQSVSGGSNILDILNLGDVTTVTEEITTNTQSNQLFASGNTGAALSTYLTALVNSSGDSLEFDANGNVELSLTVTATDGATTTTIYTFNTAHTLATVAQKLDFYHGITMDVLDGGEIAFKSNNLAGISVGGELGDFIDGNGLSITAGTVNVTTTSTTLGAMTNGELEDVEGGTSITELGLTSGSIGVKDTDGNITYHDFDASTIDTKDELLGFFSVLGFNATIADGKVSLSNDDGKTLVAVDEVNGGTNLLEKLGITDWTVADVQQTSNSIQISDSSTAKIQNMNVYLSSLTDSTGASLGITAGQIYKYDNGVTPTLVTIDEDETLESLKTKLGSNFDVQLTNGVLYITGTGNSYLTTDGIESGASNILTQLGIEDWTAKTTSTSKALQAEAPVKTLLTNEKLSDVKLLELKDSSGNPIASAGDITIVANGNPVIKTIDENTTVQEFLSWFDPDAFDVSFANGAITINGKGNSYIEGTDDDSTPLGKMFNDTTTSTGVTSESIKILDSESFDPNIVKLKDLQVGTPITEGWITVVKDGVSNNVEINENMTVQQFINATGLTGSVNANNQIVFTSNGNDCLKACTDPNKTASNVLDVLGIGEDKWDNTYKYTSKSALVETNTEAVTGEVTEDTLLVGFDKDRDGEGVTAGEFYIYNNGVQYKAMISSGDTFGDFIDTLRSFGLQAGLVNGNVVISGSNGGNSYIATSESTFNSNIVEELFATGTNDIYTEYTGTLYEEVDNIVTTYAEPTSKIKDFCPETTVVAGTLAFTVNGDPCSVEIDENETFESLIDKLGRIGIKAKLTDSKFQIHSGFDDVEIITDTNKTTSGIVDALGIDVAVKEDGTPRDLGGYSQSKETLIAQVATDTILSAANYASKGTLANKNTKLADVGITHYVQNSNSGKFNISVNGTDYEITIDANDTFETLETKIQTATGNSNIKIDFFETDPNKEDGILRLYSTGQNDIINLSSISGGSNIVEVLNMVADDENGLMSANKLYTDEGSTKLSDLNISQGTFTVYRDGQKAQITIEANETFASLETKIQNELGKDVVLTFEKAGTDLLGTGNRQDGILRIFSTEEGVEIKTGSTTDNSNFAAITGLISDGEGGVRSAREMYNVHGNSKLTTSGLFRTGDITEGTFKIGDAEFEITNTTTLNDLINMINTNDDANATAYWDNIKGQFVIKSQNSGASLLNIEAGTSNFTDIMGFTKTENGVSKLVIENQELGQNAEFSINGVKYTSTSNTIDSSVTRIEGLTINLKNVTPEGEPITIKVEKDKDTLGNAIQDVVDSYNQLMKNVDKQIAINGALHDETTLKYIRDRIWRLMTSSELGTQVFKNLDAIGISSAEAAEGNVQTGDSVVQLKFDKEKFYEAYQGDPNSVRELLLGKDEDGNGQIERTTGEFGIFNEIEALLEDSVLAAVTGYFDSTTKSYNNRISTLDNKINKATISVERYRARLEKKFASMDLLIGNIQNQYSSFLGTSTGLLG